MNAVKRWLQRMGQRMRQTRKSALIFCDCLKKNKNKMIKREANPFPSFEPHKFFKHWDLFTSPAMKGGGDIQWPKSESHSNNWLYDSQALKQVRLLRGLPGSRLGTRDIPSLSQLADDGDTPSLPILSPWHLQHLNLGDLISPQQFAANSASP